MKKRVLSIIFAAVMCLSLFGCGSAAKETASSAEAKNTFVVGFDAEFPPYGYKADNGEYTGFDLELAAELCSRKGWELVKQPIDWDSKDMELKSGSIDCIWNGFTMNGREDQYEFTVPYINNSIVVVVGKDSGIAKLADLEGKVVCVQADSSGLAAFEGEDATEENKALAKKFGDLQQVADYNTAFMNLEAGAVDAVVLDIGVAKYQMNNNKDKYVMLSENVTTEEYAIGFALGNTSLRDEVQETLLEMAKDGTVAKIAENYKDFNLPETICIGE